MVQIIFLLFALLTLGSALAVLLTRNVLYAAFFLLLTLLGVAGLFVLAGADFLAVAQVMIYVGGVLVLIIFGVMLTHKRPTEVSVPSTRPNYILTRNRGWFWPLVVAVGVFVALYSVLVRANFVLFNREAVWQQTPELIGRQLMTEFSLPFEMAGLLLLIALIGAATLAAGARTNPTNDGSH